MITLTTSSTRLRPNHRTAFRGAAFLKASAAAGGGLLLSLALPLARGEANAADAERLRAQRLHPHRPRRADHADHALRRDGPGHLHVDPHADRRRAGGRPVAGAPRARSAERKALRQSAARRAGHRQLECGTSVVAAIAPGGRDGPNHADRGRREAMERRSGVLPRAKRRRASRSNATKRQIWRSRCRSRGHAGAGKGCAESDRRISSSSARRPSGWIYRRRSTEPLSTASTFARRA